MMTMTSTMTTNMITSNFLGTALRCVMQADDVRKNRPHRTCGLLRSMMR